MYNKVDNNNNNNNNIFFAIMIVETAFHIIYYLRQKCGNY